MIFWSYLQNFCMFLSPNSKLISNCVDDKVKSCKNPKAHPYPNKPDHITSHQSEVLEFFLTSN